MNAHRRMIEDTGAGSRGDTDEQVQMQQQRQLMWVQQQKQMKARFEEEGKTASAATAVSHKKTQAKERHRKAAGRHDGTGRRNMPRSRRIPRGQRQGLSQTRRRLRMSMKVDTLALGLVITGLPVLKPAVGQINHRMSRSILQPRSVLQRYHQSGPEGCCKICRGWGGGQTT